MELDDCGKELHLTNLSGYSPFNAKIQMVIKAPRGTMVLFEHEPALYSKYLGCTFGDVQCEAIKAFMEEHYDQA